MGVETEALRLTEDEGRSVGRFEGEIGVLGNRVIRGGSIPKSDALYLLRLGLDALETPEGDTLRDVLAGVVDEYEWRAERSPTAEPWNRKRARLLRTLVGDDS